MKDMKGAKKKACSGVVPGIFKDFMLFMVKELLGPDWLEMLLRHHQLDMI